MKKKHKKQNQLVTGTNNFPTTKETTIFSLGRQATIQSTRAGFQPDCFLILVESFYETYKRTGPISSKHVCIVTTRRMWQFQKNKNVNHISCMVSDSH